MFAWMAGSHMAALFCKFQLHAVEKMDPYLKEMLLGVFSNKKRQYETECIKYTIKLNINQKIAYILNIHKVY